MQEWDRSSGLAKGHIKGTSLNAPPKRKLTILTCMDARIDMDALFQLELGDAHVIRNAGGLATDDAVRSIAASQRLLGTEEILVIHHTNCGIHQMAPSDFLDQIETDTGVRPPWEVPSTGDPESTLELTLEILASATAIPHRDQIHGAVIELHTGNLLKHG